MKEILAIKFKGEVFTRSQFARQVGKFQSLIGNNIKDKIVAVKIENPIHFIEACSAIAGLKGTIFPIDNLKMLDSDTDLLLSDDENDKKHFNNVIIADLDSVSDFKVPEDIEYIGNVKLSDFSTSSLIRKEMLNNWVEFNKNIMKTDCSETIFMYRNKKDLFKYIWTLPLCMDGNLTIAGINEEIDFKEYTNIIMPIEGIDIIKKSNNCTNKSLITYGDETVEFKKIKDIITDYEIKWNNYYGFPNVTWLSAAKEFIINGKSGLYNEIKPIKNIKLGIVNESGQIQPENAIGFIAEKISGETRLTQYMGCKLSNGSIVAISYKDGIIYKNGTYLNLKEVEEQLCKLDCIKDFYVEGTNVYYSTDIALSGFKLDSLLKEVLPEEYFPLNYIEVPFIARDLQGKVNVSKLEKMNDISYNKLNEISSEIYDLGIDSAITVDFNNDEKFIDMQPLNNMAEISPSKEISEGKISYIKNGDLDYSKQKFVSITELIQERAKGNQKIIYIEHEGRVQQTYNQLYLEAGRVANGLKENGVKANDKVILQLPNNKDYLETFWACILIGAIPAPLAVLDDYGTKNLNTDKILNICKLLENPFIITSSELVEPINNIKESLVDNKIKVLNFSTIKCGGNFENPHVWDIEKPCLIMFTSGSTGIPKGVMLNQRNIFARTLCEIEMYNFDENEIDLNWMTLTHAAGLIWTHIRDMYLNMLQIQVKSEVILNEPLMWIDLLNEYKATITWAPNFAYSLISNELSDEKYYDWDLSKLKYIFATAEANVSRNLRNFIIKLKKYKLSEDAIKPSFGMTETSSVMIYYNNFSLNNTSDEDKFVPIGTPAVGHEFRVTDDEGNVLPEGVVGNIEGKGQTITSGYYDNEAANKESFTLDGYFKTGDLGYIKDNNIILTGRAKEVIIINGLNYYVQDIESVVEDLEEVNPSFTVATSIKNKQNEEEVLVIFTPRNEESLDDIPSLKKLVNKIKREIREKCMIYPTYVIPDMRSKSIRTELGKKQRSKYKKAFENGEYDDIIQKMGGTNLKQKYVMEEFWQRVNIAASIKTRIKDKITVISEDKEYVDKLFVDSNLKYETLNENEISKIKSNYCIDLTIIENKSTNIIEFSKKILQHFAEISKLKQKMKIILPTTNAFVLENDKIFNIQNGILRGFIKSFNLENSEKSCKIVDFDIFDFDLCINELLSSNKDTEVVYRNKKRYKSFLESIPELKDNEDIIKDKSVILLLGGLGGIGRNVCKYLLEKYDAKLIIFGSSKLVGEKKEVFDNLRSISKNIIYQDVDINDNTQMSTVLSRCEKEFGEKTTVFINLAGKISADKNKKSHWEDISNHIIENETMFSMEEVIKSKVNSTLAIEKLREERKNSILIMFSSINGYFGGVSLSAYSAANSFQDSYCRYLNNNEKATFCINWSTWVDVGISESIPEGIQKASSKSGFYANTVEENIECFRYILDHNIKNGFIGVDRNFRKYRHFIKDKYRRDITVFYTGDKLNEIKRIVRDRVNDIDAIQYQNIESIPRNSDNRQDIDFNLLARLSINSAKRYDEENLSDNHKKMIKIWKETLKVQSVGINDDFYDIGGNSILVSKLLFKIANTFNVNVSFQDILNATTIEKLTNLIENIKDKSVTEIARNTDEFKEILRNEVKLDFSVKSYLEKISVTNEDRNILVSGSTGFFGGYLLKYLLLNTDYHIYLLVRAQDRNEAKLKVMEHLKRYELQNYFVSDRVTIIKGDISKENLGMSNDEYSDLCKNIDVILHSAAEVNFVSPFDKVKVTNIDGTRRIIKFACEEKVKLLHYISSYSVYDCLENRRNFTANERTELTFDYKHELNAYTLSKCVADSIVRLANEEGLPCKIYRIGTITGDLEKGRCQVRDFFWTLINASLKLKKMPIMSNIVFHLVPVDILADIVIKLSKRPYDFNENIYNLEFEMLYLSKVFEWLKNIEPSMEIAAYEEWRKDLIVYAEEHNDDLLLSILPIFPNAEVIEEVHPVDVDSSFTQNILNSMNLNRMGINYDNFKKTYEYLKEINFFRED
ncbi:thioester reductase-like protein [Clostridium saccharoperbutylacetonicum]|uniref:Polyketide synthase PksJ n=1 Tax=Clostridium saccharoperbutylacetonicum N1-4(HMT) TaxID=931276 RepID=M1MCS7_9CLOT|nr:thioester reductase domain-containing protein [Clostridium saccharoperbutylacetonicum]AGF54203.1 polyketide synthase PksJ [Clostridium saccharoperbutylacetonicum N1-4(HMT)]NRT59283.1 thioester reductase-like protein [Clostridium saccharoperbutylacetonicum]NSB28473.1 thioester reductase-like protein [Clostridium saccharoperbutylacetonicum]NSB41962.1 thioester reductase-like protein [Clostridium saccharoperbutylacetonicum]